MEPVWELVLPAAQVQGSADNLVISGGNVNLIKSGGGYCIGSTDVYVSSVPNIRITGGNVTATVSGDTGKIWSESYHDSA